MIRYHFDGVCQYIGIGQYWLLAPFLPLFSAFSDPIWPVWLEFARTLYDVFCPVGSKFDTKRRFCRYRHSREKRILKYAIAALKFHTSSRKSAANVPECSRICLSPIYQYILAISQYLNQRHIGNNNNQLTGLSYCPIWAFAVLIPPLMLSMSSCVCRKPSRGYAQGRSVT